jgi:hypothetical protein
MKTGQVALEIERVGRHEIPIMRSFYALYEKEKRQAPSSHCS